MWKIIDHAKIYKYLILHPLDSPNPQPKALAGLAFIAEERTMPTFRQPQVYITTNLASTIACQLGTSHTMLQVHATLNWSLMFGGGGFTTENCINGYLQLF